MADESTEVATKEQVSMCVRYVHVKAEELEVCEDFVQFLLQMLQQSQQQWLLSSWLGRVLMEPPI